ncbi:uncharacterized protein LOC113851105 [Abrus precatorius]|uniref:Uncharacterized protein LOC113851105 n=1 Tax=Abrus precatorius TaxID=3816 RepID=A0A8B8K176_ABRPR|nr:uncharacterized protein LOC113851105 [Abrus precatorius]
MASLVGIYQFLSSPDAKVWLKEHLIDLKLYEARVEDLTAVVPKLKRERERVQHRVEEEESRHGRGISDEIKEWIKRVDKVISEHEDFDGDHECHELAALDFFTNGYLPKPGIRYRRSRKANDIIGKVNGLLQKAPKFDSFSYWLGPPSMESFFSNVDYERLPSRDEAMEKIKTALEDPSVRIIGLHGLSGVGKTTLVKELAKDFLEANTFKRVIMANVTRNPDIRKIQGQIADMLGKQLDGESDIARADQIRNRLKNEKEGTLIILDDLCEKLDFNMLGIPSVNNNNDYGSMNVKEGTSLGAVMGKPEKNKGTSKVMKPKTTSGASNRMQTDETHYRGCKVLLISEIKQVLLSQMGGKESSIFQLEALKENEPKILFTKMAGINERNFEFVKLAAQIADKCNGLPMLIVTTAKALKNQSRSTWEDVRRQLEWQKSTGSPEFSTKLSYQLLEDEELKYTFLLCARMGHDTLLMDLVKYCVGLGFLQGIYTVREARDRVYSLVGKLKGSGLLSDSYSTDHFTMQDIVRSAALSIASKDKQVFTMTKAKVDELHDKFRRYAAISLHHCDIIEGFPRRINCPKLTVFHVNNIYPHLEIPDNLFQGMKELKVLILTGFHRSPLPPSIRFLTKLRMLCLEQCVLGKDLSFIAVMKMLRILSFSGSDIEKLPVELMQLTNLQIFDISNCFKLNHIPSNVISSLISLEELYMRNTLIQFKVDQQTKQSLGVLLSELRHLNQLTILDIQIPYIAQLPKNLFFDKLYSYKIVIGELNAYLETDFKMPEKHERSRFLAIQLKKAFDIHSQIGIKMLFDRVENLLLEDLEGVQDLFYRLNLKGFPYLKSLSIVNNSHILSLIDPKKRRQHPEKAFPKLESLYLYNLKKMERLCSCRLSAPSFTKLKVIKINLCSELKNIFLISMVKLLIVLETIEVSECNSLDYIVDVEQHNNRNEELKFLELRSLTLRSLPQFVGFSSRAIGGIFNEKVVVSKLERLELSLIQSDRIWSKEASLCSYFQNLRHLDVNYCWNLTNLLSFSMAKSMLNLQSLFVSECENMECIFVEGAGSSYLGKMKDRLFPNLKNIKLTSMKSLSEIWNSEVPPDSFAKLETLIIEKCDKLVNVFPLYMEKMFQSLCTLRVTNCKSMKAIFDLKNKRRDAGNVTNLQDVHLETLPKLEKIWKDNQEGALKLNNLQKLRVRDCDSLKNIFPFPVAHCLNNLEYLMILDCFELREIVAKREGIKIDGSRPTPTPAPAPTPTPTQKPFLFPKLMTVKFSNLPKLKCFYPEVYELSCPALKDLSIELCDKLEPFEKESADAHPRKPIFPEEVINKLKAIQIELWHANSSSSYMGEGNYRSNNLEELQLSKFMNTEILYSFLHNNPNLQSLSLNNCSFKEIVPLKRRPEIQNLGVVPKLKSLKLIDLPMLEKIGFERDIVLQRIESLILKNCPSLDTIVPSSVFLAHLTYLEVVECNGLRNLMAPSTAMGQLNIMKVMKCESLEQIVRDEGTDADKVEIVFKQLRTLELVSLKNLKSFCSSESCVFEFPSLEKLVKCFEGMEEMNFSEHPELQKAWQSNDAQLLENWFSSLTTLKLVECKIQPYAVPSNILPCLMSLKELEVHNCKKIKAIFDMENREDTIFQLKNLSLKELPKLRLVWEKNGQGILSFQNLQHVFVSGCKRLPTLFPVALARNLKKLEKLEIQSCHKLFEIVEKEKAAATAEVPEEFVFLRLTVLNLYDLPQLTHFYPQTFTVECPALSNLTVLDCGVFEVFQTPEDEHSTAEGEGSSISINRQPLFSNLKVIAKLEELSLDWKYTSILRSWIASGQFEENLKYLNGLSLFFDCHDDDTPNFPIQILEKAPNLEQMSLEYCKKPEIFLTQNPVKDGMLEQLKELAVNVVSDLPSIGSNGPSLLNAICERLHQLYVFDCSDLRAVVDSSSTVSFANLKILFISECPKLEYLITSSAAEKLKHLEELMVVNCELLKGIVANEQNQPTSGVIEFKQLDSISLISLSKLECFYSGTATLDLPSLIQVQILQCPDMKYFSQNLKVGKSFRGIQGSDNVNDDLIWGDNFNSSVEKVSLLQRDNLYFKDSPMLKEIWLGSEIALSWCFSNLSSLVLEGCDFLSNAILPSHLLPLLRNLKKLQVRECNSIKAIFDHIMMINGNGGPNGNYNLPLLKNLSVENCEGLVQFVAKDEATVEEANKELIIFQKLTSLKLLNLPNLRCIYPGIGILEMPKLRKLDVSSCPRLTTLVHSTSTVSSSNLKFFYLSKCGGLEYLFTSSTVNKFNCLKHFSVEECESMKVIVAKEQGDTSSEVIKFERLELMVLSSLSSLECFYSGSATLELSSLTAVQILQCPKMENFSMGSTDAKSFTGIQVSTDSNDDLVLHNDINGSVKRIFLQQDHLALGDSRMLQEIWLKPEPLPSWCFCNLNSLIIEGCEFLSNGILPCHLLPFLSNLEKLQVQKCNSVEAIFDLTQMNNMEPASVPLSIPLKKLILDQLPILKHVWNGDPQVSLNLPFLEEVLVNECDSIKGLFPASVINNKLQKLHVENCAELVEIVVKNELAVEETNKELVIFPSLTLLKLWNLPKLRCIHSGKHMPEWPMLKELHVFHCQMLKFFATDFQNSTNSHSEGQDSFPTDQQAIVSLEKCFHDKSDVFPFIFHSKVSLPNIEKLGVLHSAFEEIFPTETPDTNRTIILSHLRVLELRRMSHLKSIGFEQSWMSPILQNLEDLLVWECHCLTNLTPSSVSFSNLIKLNVNDCCRLEYLFTSSTAKTLHLLKEMHVTNCISLKAIVAKDQDEKANTDSDEDQEKEANGSATLNLPSLKEMSFTHCHRTKVFHLGDAVPKELKVTIDGVHWEGDINSVIKRQSEKEAA